MIINKIRTPVTSLIVLLMLAAPPAMAQNAFELSQMMISACKGIKTMRFTLEKEERIEGKMFSDRFGIIKAQFDPLKVYQKQDYPREGLELLFKEGENGNDALINTNGFPWINVSLSPWGNRMRENQHHTVHKMGYSSMMEILEFLYAKYKDKAPGMMSIEGATKWDGHDCWILKMTNDNFGYHDYTVREGEDLIKIPQRYRLSEHMILEYNDLGSYTNPDEGDVIRIPEDYAKGMELYLDKKRHIPLVIKVYDDKGLYEHYKYMDVQINIPIAPEEFTSEYLEYGF